MRKLVTWNRYHFDENILSNGTVVRVEIDEELPYGWESEDEKISEVGWWEIPAELYWGQKEIQRLLDYDWRASSSLAS